MKALKGKIDALWLIVLIIVLSALAVYRIGLHIPVPAFNEEAVKSLGGSEAQTKPHEAEPAASAGLSEAVFPPSHSSEPEQVHPTHQYRSEHPLYFRVVFGEEGNDSMLGVFGESGGTGTGYDVTYVDENMNGDLMDEVAKAFPRLERGSRKGELDPRVEFTGPLKNGERARYTLYLSSLTRQNQSIVPGNDYSFHWFLDNNQWNYFFINGKVTLFSNAPDALKGKPVRLGGQCQWQISARSRYGKPTISAGLKDENGCTLRSVRLANKRLSPTLTLTLDGQVKVEEKMKFG